MHECVINIGTVLPKSLKHLTIRDSPCLTSAPGLVTLEVADCHGWTPLFKSLPSLVAAFINTRYLCVVCHGRADFVFLEGLSGATNLELTAEYFMIFRTDIEWCPMFSRLKTLLLSDWCMAHYFHGLVFFLKHSPILERLTLEHSTLSKQWYGDTTETCKPKDKFLVSKHLKAVEINHVKDDKRIHLLLKVLAFHGVYSELINFKEKYTS
ncbi:hypothetical protein VPH35_099354 [Triticum aestivum]